MGKFLNKNYVWLSGIILVIVGPLTAGFIFAQTAKSETKEGVCQTPLQFQSPAFYVTNTATGAGEWRCQATAHMPAIAACLPSYTLSNKQETIGSCEYYTGRVLDANSNNRSCEKLTDNNFLSKVAFTCAKNYPYCLPQGATCDEGDVAVPDATYFTCSPDKPVKCDLPGREIWQDVSGSGNNESCVAWLQRTGQLGARRRVVKSDGGIILDECIYKLNLSGGIQWDSASDSGYNGGYAVSLANPEAGPSGSSVYPNSASYIPSGAKTQSYIPIPTPLPPVIPKPAAPSLDGFYNESEETVNLSWNGVANADNYEIYRAVKLGNFQSLARLNSGATSYIDNGIPTPFKGGMRYQVRALGAGGVSDFSNIITVEIIPAVGGPTIVPPVCSVGNVTPSAYYPVTFTLADLQTSFYKYIWLGVQTGDIGCGENGSSCTTAPLISDLSAGAYRVEVHDSDTNQVKQIVNCPAVDVRMPKLKAEVITR